MDNAITVNMENLTQEERKQLISLVEKSNKPSFKKRWRAEENGTYYFINPYLDTMQDIEKYANVDNQCYKIGNYFKTKEEAEFEKEKILVYQELKDYALEHNECEFDWSNKYQYKYYLFYNVRVSVGFNNISRYPCKIYFTSREIARDAINSIGEDRIKKYIFGVK